MVRVYKPDGNYEAKCIFCNRSFRAGGKAGTSNLNKHLKNCVSRKRVMADKKDVGQQLLAVNGEGEGKGEGVQTYEYDPVKSRRDYLKAVIVHEYPFNMANHLFFIKFLKGLNPSFKLNKRTTIRRECLALYEQEKLCLYNELEKLDSRVSLTTDLWTSNRVQGYLSLTCHYIDSSWVMRKKILSFAYVPSPHTGVILSEVIFERILEWNIDRKLFSLVADNAASNDAMIDLLTEKSVISQSLPVQGNLFHVRCGAHILNLIVHDGLKVVKSVIENIRETVKYIKKSQFRVERFEKCAKQAHAPDIRLVADVPTRWNSTFLMLETALKFRDAISRYAQLDKDYEFLPSNSDWENVKALVPCLQVFYVITNRISGTKYPTLNLFFTDFCEVYMNIRSWYSSPYPFICEMAARMFRKFEKYWNRSSVLLAIASTLDPRYKFKPVQFYYKDMYPTDGEGRVEHVRTCLKTLFEEYVHQNNQPVAAPHAQPSSSNTAQASTSSNPPVSGRRLGLEQFIQESQVQVPNRSELEVYLDDPLVPGMNDANFDVLVWWKLNSPKYPILSRVVRDVLAVSVSTVASESAFSTGGRVIDNYRSNLKPNTVEALICTQDWLRSSVNVAEVGDYGSLLAIPQSTSVDSEVSEVTDS